MSLNHSKIFIQVPFFRVLLCLFAGSPHLWLFHDTVLRSLFLHGACTFGRLHNTEFSCRLFEELRGLVGVEHDGSLHLG